MEKIFVKEGDEVPPGGALAQLSNRDVEQDYVQAQGQLAVAQASVQRALAEDKPAELREAQAVGRAGAKARRRTRRKTWSA